MENTNNNSAPKIHPTGYNLSEFEKLCGIRITKIGGGRCTVECDISEKHLNRHESAHGGIIFTMMDVAGGRAAVYPDSGEVIFSVTQNASMCYLRAVKPGLTTAEAEVVRRGHHISVISVCVYDSDHNLAARGDFTYYHMPNKSPKSHSENEQA